MYDARTDEVAAGAPGDPPRVRNSYSRRQRLVLWTAVAAAVVSTGGLIASTFVKSPAQVAAETAPPRASLIKTPVVRQSLTPSIVLRGLVYPSAEYTLTPGSPAAGARAVVSKLLVRAGGQVQPGQQVAEVSGRPMFLLRGGVPAYRDLRPGDTGPDVAQLQAALRSLGYSSGPDDRGTFGAGTKSAVSSFYDRHGYAAPRADAGADQAVTSGTQAVKDDRAAVDRLLAAPSPAPAYQTQLAQARRQLRNDQQALDRAQTLAGPLAPASELVYLPSFPATVSNLSAVVGQTVTGPIMTLTTGDLAVTGKLPPSQARSVTPGMRVDILVELQNLAVTGTVSGIGQQTSTDPAGTVIAIGGGSAGGTGGSGGANGGSGSSAGQQGGAGGTAYLPLRIDPGRPLPAAMNGQDVRITVETAATARDVLTVPVSAISTDASGQTRVTRVGAGGGLTVVPVRTGVTSNGFVQVTPQGGQTLAAGDQVVVGQ